MFHDHPEKVIDGINPYVRMQALCLLQGILDYRGETAMANSLSARIKGKYIPIELMASQRAREYLLNNANIDKPLHLSLKEVFQYMSYPDLMALADAWLQPDDPGFHETRIHRFAQNPIEITNLLINLPDRFWTMPHIETILAMIYADPEQTSPPVASAILLRAVWANTPIEEREDLRDQIRAILEPALVKMEEGARATGA